MQISIVNGCVEYDGEPILSEINFTLNDKEKVAIVGRNGCGKTTLLKALTGEVELVAGTGEGAFGFYKSGNPTLGKLRQSFDATEQKTMEEELLSAYAYIKDLEVKMNQALELLSKDGSEKNASVYAKLHEEYERLDGYTYQKEYLTGVYKFGFTNEDLHKKLCEFSGGQRTKIALLALLLSRPDVLLLDEPTNHLDLEAIEWLEEFLMSSKNAVVLVSHDRMFLDKIVNVVYEIEYGETHRYAGNYSSFLEQKQANYDKNMKDATAKKKEIDRLTALVERFRYKAHKAKMAQAKLKQIERMGKAEFPIGFDKSTFKASFVPAVETVEKAIVCEHLSFGYSTPFGEINTVVKKGEKLGILGHNGCGKSTLIKTMMGIVPPLSGVCRFGLHAEVGYFDQTMTQNYSSATVLQDFESAFPKLTDLEARTALGAFLFTGEDVFKTVGELSGGEKARLALCKIFKKKPNILILDEPTNHMDIIGKDTLEKMLANYEGTVVTVSHDRYFLSKICTRLAIFDENGFHLFDGTYKDYEYYKNLYKNAPVSEKTEQIKKEKHVSSDKERQKKQHRLEVLEEKIAVFDEKKSYLKKEMEENPAVYSDYEKYADYEKQYNALTDEESPLLAEWETLVEELGL